METNEREASPGIVSRLALAAVLGATFTLVNAAANMPGASLAGSVATSLETAANESACGCAIPDETQLGGAANPAVPSADGSPVFLHLNLVPRSDVDYFDQRAESLAI
jgi:hypothetical protein